MSDRQALTRDLRACADGRDFGRGQSERMDWHGSSAIPDLLRELATALEEAQGVPVAWMYESERSCVGPFTDRRVTFTIDRWETVPPKYKETPLYAAPAAPTRDEQDAKRYRWLRDNGAQQSVLKEPILARVLASGTLIEWDKGGDAADASLDAALAEQKR